MTQTLHARYIPKSATKISDKQSDAIAYIYTDDRNRLCARVFFGKQTNPVQVFAYRSEAARERSVREAFERRRMWQTGISERRRAALASGRGLEIGDIVNTCWGYDQTNVEFFEITQLIGHHTVELRQLAQVREVTGWDQGRCVPQPGAYIGKPIRRIARAGRIKIDDVRIAHKWNTQPIAGVKVGPSANWSSYA